MSKSYPVSRTIDRCHKPAHTLVKLPHSTFRQDRLISSVHLGNVVSLHVDNTIHSEVSGERDLSSVMRDFSPGFATNRKIVPQTAELSTLILQIVDQLGVLTVLSSQNLSELKHWRVDRTSSILDED